MIDSLYVLSPDIFSTIKPATQYHLGDHLGSSNVVLDRDANLINREEYRPYGESSFGSYGKKRYRFTGKERDEESGPYYPGARYYAPWLARWTAADPAGMVDGPNLYEYVRGNPVKLVDPDGMESSEVDDGPINVRDDHGYVSAAVMLDLFEILEDTEYHDTEIERGGKVTHMGTRSLSKEDHVGYFAEKYLSAGYQSRDAFKYGLRDSKDTTPNPTNRRPYFTPEKAIAYFHTHPRRPHPSSNDMRNAIREDKPSIVVFQDTEGHWAEEDEVIVTMLVPSENASVEELDKREDELTPLDGLGWGRVQDLADAGGLDVFQWRGKKGDLFEFVDDEPGWDEPEGMLQGPTLKLKEDVTFDLLEETD